MKGFSHIGARASCTGKNDRHRMAWDAIKCNFIASRWTFNLSILLLFFLLLGFKEYFYYLAEENCYFSVSHPKARHIATRSRTNWTFILKYMNRCWFYFNFMIHAVCNKSFRILMQSKHTCRSISIFVRRILLTSVQLLLQYYYLSYMYYYSGLNWRNHSNSLCVFQLFIFW